MQSFDIYSAAGTIQQSATMPAQTMADFSGWVSVCAFAAALTGLANRSAAQPV
jgi:hypothetical protein